jgi:predicted nuclease of predicted toxin-antitoxin system
MSRPRFLADNDLNDHIVTGLLRREPAIEFKRAREVGLQNRPDPEVLEYAAAHGLIVVSHDVNTMPSHAYRRLTQGAPMSGLLMAKQTDPVGPVIEDLLLVWSSSEAEEWNG